MALHIESRVTPACFASRATTCTEARLPPTEIDREVSARITMGASTPKRCATLASASSSSTLAASPPPMLRLPAQRIAASARMTLARFSPPMLIASIDPHTSSKSALSSTPGGASTVHETCLSVAPTPTGSRSSARSASAQPASSW